MAAAVAAAAYFRWQQQQQQHKQQLQQDTIGISGSRMLSIPEHISIVVWAIPVSEPAAMMIRIHIRKYENMQQPQQSSYSGGSYGYSSTLWVATATVVSALSQLPTGYFLTSLDQILCLPQYEPFIANM